MATSSAFIALFLIATVLIAGSVAGDGVSDYLSALKSPRHDVTGPANKEQAKKYIHSKFTEFGLQTWTEKFTTPSSKSGENVVGILWGERMLTANKNSRAFIIGSHYDTQQVARLGEGSGVAVLLDVARRMADGSITCSRENTIIFVAWDFRYLPGPKDTNAPGIGSGAFLRNFTSFQRFYPQISSTRLDSNAIYGHIGGVVVLGSNVLYNSHQNSQTIPTDILRDTMPSSYYAVGNNSYRGNFLGLVSFADHDLLNNLKASHQSAVVVDETHSPVMLFNTSLATFAHRNKSIFANSELKQMAVDVRYKLKTVLIGDMSDFHGFQRQCTSNPCDIFGTENVQFMKDTSATVVAWLTNAVEEKCELKTKYKILRDHLDSIKGPRNDLTYPARKAAAREYIASKMEEFGLHVWIEPFSTAFANITGLNVVGRINGDPSAGTYLVGAHYDTMPNTNGVDDNGSGVAALLRAAQLIAEKPNSPIATIIFVAFDYEEWDDGSPCLNVACGSLAFVKNLTSYSGFNATKFKGAIIMDTIMDVNDEPNTQYFPSALQVLPVYKVLQQDQLRGDRLVVIARDVDAISVHFQAEFSKTGSKLADITSPYVASFPGLVRSDHKPFWDNGLPAVFLTDSADFRGIMRQCYHRSCDRLVQLPPRSLRMVHDVAAGIVGTTYQERKSNTGSSAAIHPASIFVTMVSLLFGFAVQIQ